MASSRPSDANANLASLLNIMESEFGTDDFSFKDIENLIITQRVEINRLLSNGITPAVFFVRRERYDAARFLIEQGATTKEVKEELKKQKELNDDFHYTALQDTIRLFDSSSPPARPLTSYDYCQQVRHALVKDNLDQVKYSQLIMGPALFAAYETILFQALYLGAVRGLDFLLQQFIADHYSFSGIPDLRPLNLRLNASDYYGSKEKNKLAEERKSLFDCNENTLLMSAIKLQKINVVEYLLKHHGLFPLDIDLEHKNKQGETLFDVMRPYPEIQKLFKETQYNQVMTYNSFTAAIQDCLLTLPAFVLATTQYKTVTIKGLALLLYYHAHKRRQALVKETHPRYSEEEAQLFEKALVVRRDEFITVFKHFISANENRLLMIHVSARELSKKNCSKFYSEKYPERIHHKVIYCEKKDGLFHIVFVDSYIDVDHSSIETFNSLVARLLEEVDDVFRPLLRFYINQTTQQTDYTSCPFFAIKNAAHIARSQNFLESVIKAVIREEPSTPPRQDFYYILPPAFMNLTQSYDRFEKYENDNQSAVAEYRRVNKKGEKQTLRDYTFMSRKGFGVETPEKIQNTHYEKEAAAPEFVWKNHTVLYFKAKYLEMLRQMVQGLSQAELRRIITHHSTLGLFAKEPVVKAVPRAVPIVQFPYPS